MPVLTGLGNLIQNVSLQKKIKGNIAYLCHSASVTADFTHGIIHLQKIFKKRLTKLLGPQHGLVTNVQDNMVESVNFLHPYFELPVYSLYSHTRKPTPEMLEGIDTLIVDLQDVGTRVYTYISTLGLCLEACAPLGIEVVVLDRPNPVGGEIIEGSMLQEEFQSFVGFRPMPMRHGMTMGEMALFYQKLYFPVAKLSVIPMKGWKRKMFWKDTGLPWVNPSPNLTTPDSALTFVGTVLFEGTNISEGRGTTRSLEIIGHPDIEPFSFLEKLHPHLKKAKLEGFVLRPLYFQPTFQKHAGKSCGGFQIHVTDPLKFRPWKLGQLLCQQLYQHLGQAFEWKAPPYEYEYEKLPIDLINGSDGPR
ncbi:MAG: DUF1343 domain-containing protein, partial [Pseudomonadota bacterium]